jgi:hypothetical protein
MNFFPSKGDSDIWMRKAGDVWEYVAVYVDDLAMALKDPQAFIDELKSTTISSSKELDQLHTT